MNCTSGRDRRRCIGIGLMVEAVDNLLEWITGMIEVEGSHRDQAGAVNA